MMPIKINLIKQMQLQSIKFAKTFTMKKTTTLLLFLFLGLIAFGQVNLNQGLIAYYPFSGNANDSSGNNNHGVVYGATLTSGLLGIPNTAYHFNGLNGFIEVPNSPTLTSVLISMCAVINIESFNPAVCQGNVIMWKGANFLTGHYGLHLSDAVVDPDCNTFDSLHETFYPEISGNGTGAVYSPFTTSNTWYCVVATFDGDSCRIYVNGDFKYSVYTPIPIGINSDPLDFGHNIYNALYPYWFHGVMDEIRIYDRVLSDIEVSAYCSLVNGIHETNNIPLFELNNLSGGIYTLKLKENYKTLKLSVYNYLGEKITSENIGTGNSETEHTINLSDHSNGFYLLEIIADGKQITRKLIK